MRIFNCTILLLECSVICALHAISRLVTYNELSGYEICDFEVNALMIRLCLIISESE